VRSVAALALSLDGLEVVPWPAPGTSRRAAATRDDELASEGEYSRMIGFDSLRGVALLRELSREMPEGEYSRMIGLDSLRGVTALRELSREMPDGEDSRMIDRDSARGAAALRALSREMLEGADRSGPDDTGPRDGPISLGVARAADGAEPPPPLERGAGADGADGAEAEGLPPGVARALCCADAIDAVRIVIDRTESRARMSCHRSNSTASPSV